MWETDGSCGMQSVEHFQAFSLGLSHNAQVAFCCLTMYCIDRIHRVVGDWQQFLRRQQGR